jgi:hypothetical protein
VVDLAGTFYLAQPTPLAVDEQILMFKASLGCVPTNLCRAPGYWEGRPGRDDARDRPGRPGRDDPRDPDLAGQGYSWDRVLLKPLMPVALPNGANGPVWRSCIYWGFCSQNDQGNIDVYVRNQGPNDQVLPAGVFDFVLRARFYDAPF